ncbi:hypothetical protein [Endozoicomonas sp. ALD068]|uniref:hypothetical protein n=2 Tax=Endozoicomonas TaxID=305899 RepID=UPI003BB7F293
MKSSCATICYPSYKIRCFLSVFFLAFCALSLSAYSVGSGASPDTTTPPPDTPTDTTAPSPDNLTDTTAPPQSTPTGLLPNSTSPEAMTNPCNSLSHEPIAFKACNDFLNNEKASRGRFSTAVVVSNARELDEAVTGKFPEGNPDASRLVVLKNEEYRITRALDISHKIALVGTVKDNKYPVIRIHDEFKSENNSIAYLHHDSKVAETGFYSYHIHWIANLPSPENNGVIYSDSYRGELRIYENKFSDESWQWTNHFIQLKNAIGDALIGNNHFETDYLTASAIMARCESTLCKGAESQLEVVNNHFYSKFTNSSDQLKLLDVLGYMRFTIADNRQENEDAAGTIYIKDHRNIKHMAGYVRNNVAHKDAPELQRRIIVESSHSADHDLRVTGELIVRDNDHYTFHEAGLPPRFIDYFPGKQVIMPSQTTAASSTVKAASSVSVSPDAITPTGSLIAATASVRPLPAKTEPCNDIRDHPTAFATCKAFLQNELASGPAANKPAFSHAFVVATVAELLKAINKTIGEDGRAIRGRIILLKPGDYELPGEMRISQRTAMVGLEGRAVGLPVIKPSGHHFYSPSHRGNPSLLYLSTSHDSSDAGFYSWNLEWQTQRPFSSDGHPFKSHISAKSYSGDIRIYQNRFSHYESRIRSEHAVALEDNPGYKYYIGHSTFDSSLTPVSVIRSSASANPQAAIEVDSNVFATARSTDLSQPSAIALSDYQHLKINNNLQADRHAAGAIKLKFANYQHIESASIKNNTANKDAPEDARVIELKLEKSLFDPAKVYGDVNVYRNDYYGLKILDFTNYSYTAGLEVSTSTPTSLTPSQSIQTASVTDSYKPFELGANKTTVVSSATASLTPTTSPVFSSLCDQRTDADKAQLCQQLLNELQKEGVKTTFSEVVIVKNIGELLYAVDTASESGKVILLEAGSYELNRPLRMLWPVALVGVGNTVIKQSIDYPAEAESLVLLDSNSSAQGFFSKGITWDISAVDNIRGKPLYTAVKAVDYRGKLLMSSDEFQYNVNRENEKAPSHYVEVQDSSGDVIITGSTFFSGGLTKAAIYADCKNCLEEVQKMDISGNRFTDSNSGESAPAAIDVRHYRILKVRKNVQETESVSVNISVVLPNNNDDIYAFVADNIAMGSAIDEKKTIDVTVARLAKEPARIDGLVQVYSNRCFSVNLDEIPSDILEFAEGNCSALPNIQALRGSPTPSHNGLSTGQWVGIGFAVGAAAVFGGCGLYGLTNLPGHGRAWSFFILPKTLALAATAKVLAWCNQRKWGSLSEDDAVSFSPSEGVEMKTGLTKDPEMNLGESEGDQFPLIENPIMEPEL